MPELINHSYPFEREFREDINDLKSSISKVAETLAKFALLEERHQQIAATTNRILERIEKMEERQRLSEISRDTLGRFFDSIDKQANKIDTLERSAIEDKARTDGILKTVRVLWVAIGGVMVWLGTRVMDAILPAIPHVPQVSSVAASIPK